VPLADLTAGEDARVLARVTRSVKEPETFAARVQHLYAHPALSAHDAFETADGRFIDRDTVPLHTPGEQYLGRVWYFRDVTERQRAANALAYRDRLLHAVMLGTGILMKAESLAQGMPEALRTLGESLRVDRVVLLQESLGATAHASISSVWEAPDIGSATEFAGLLRSSLDQAPMDVWRAQLAAGNSVIAQIATSEGPIRRHLEDLQSKSILIMPILVGRKLWGRLGIDTVREARSWTANEIDTLKTFAGILGSLILRDASRLSLESSEVRFRVLTATAQDAIITIDAQGLISHWNRAAERILGYAAEEAMGRPIHSFMVPPRFRESADRNLKNFRMTGEGAALGKTLEFAAIRKDGSEIAIEISLAGAQLDGQWQAIGILRDITERKRVAALALRMARYDVLTGLANRAVFVEAVAHAIAVAKRGEDGFAVLYIDLDHFKDVNDTLGHPIGDGLLQAVADRIRSITRETDTVARFGGDEFAVIAANVVVPADAAILAEKLIQALGTPFSIEGNEIYSGVSIGIAAYGPEAPDAEALLSHADVALYRAKAEGRDCYRFFTNAMDREVKQRVTLGTELRDAIDLGQLFLLYQPQVALKDGAITGVEALVRWHHPRRGMLGPDLFIPIAEQIGIIARLGRWVLFAACRQARIWLESGIAPSRITVNVSALQFRAALALEADVAAALAETGLPAAMLELELTESVLMEGSREHHEVIGRFRSAGITMAIDDFGTGYSSLEYLRRFPSNRIKIAQNFVTNLESSPGDAAIVRATIGLARELGMNVIAEGARTKEQCELLISWGCAEGQGFYFAPPLSSDEATAALRVGQIRPARPIVAQ
jgi:diguanylate cyclase (GGDEF)-like protein/PAS domain S-box-containing protein